MVGKSMIFERVQYDRSIFEQLELKGVSTSRVSSKIQDDVYFTLVFPEYAFLHFERSSLPDNWKMLSKNRTCKRWCITVGDIHFHIHERKDGTRFLSMNSEAECQAIYRNLRNNPSYRGVMKLW